MDQNDLAAGKPEDAAELLKKLADAVPDILFIMDLRSKKLLFINRAVETVLGYSKTEVAKMPDPFFDVIFPDDLPRVLAHIEEMKTARADEVREISYRMVDAKGDLRWFRDRNSVFKVNEEGFAIIKTGVLRDITVQKKEEEELAGHASVLKEAEEKIQDLNRVLQAKNYALESVNSEIKTLNSIASTEYKETLQKLYTNLEFVLTHDAQNLSDAGKGNLRRMQAAIQKMKLLTEDIVSFSKLQTLDDVLVPVDLNRILRIVIKDIDGKLEESGGVVQAEQLPEIKGYPLLLSLLFFHLVDNAIKFRKEDAGSTPIKIVYTADSINPEGENKDMLYHRITVRDDGIGFHPEHAEKIFSMFYKIPATRKFRGSGIGLAICKKIMDIHGGIILAESNQNGAAFHCLFPKSL